MRKILCFLFFISLQVNSNAQNWIWAKSGMGSGVGSEGISICLDDSGNVFSTGMFQCTTLIFGNDTLQNAGVQNIYIVKYDSSGNEIWARSAGGNGNNGDWAYSISCDDSGNAYITGYFSSATVTFGSFTLTNSGSDDIFIAKYDPFGNVIWAKSVGGNNSDQGLGISVGVNGFVFITGFFVSPTINFGSTTLTNTGAMDIFIAKYDIAGNLVWAKSATGSSFEKANAVSADDLGNVFITGSFSSATITFGNISLSNSGANDFFIAKYDAAGNILWAKSAVGNSAEIGNSICANVSGDVYVTGCSSSSTVSFGNYTLTNSGVNDIFLTKYGKAGNVLWAKSAGGNNQDIGYSCCADMNGFVYVTGEMMSPSATFDYITVSPPPANCTPFFCDPFFVAKYDSLGNAICVNVLASGGDDWSGITPDQSGNVYVTGDFLSHPFFIGADTLTLTGNEDAFVAKYNCPFTTGMSINAESAALAIFPNPSSGKFMFNLNEHTSSRIIIYNTIGEIIFQSEFHTTQFEVDLTGQPEGIYFVSALMENGISSSKKIAVQH
jgi:hypothetical protein